VASLPEALETTFNWKSPGVGRVKCVTQMTSTIRGVIEKTEERENPYRGKLLGESALELFLWGETSREGGGDGGLKNRP